MPDVRRTVLIGLSAALLASAPPPGASVQAADSIQATVRANPLAVGLSLSPSHVEQGEPFVAVGDVRNDGAVALDGVQLRLAVDGGVAIVDGPPTRDVGDLGPAGTLEERWTLCAAESGIYLVTLHGTATASGEEFTVESQAIVVEVVAGDRVCGGFQFSGFYQPVENPPTINRVAGGRGIPVKFSLGGDHGLAILAAGYPSSVRVTCDGGAPMDAIEQTVSASASGLSYDAATDRYTYVWKTDRAWRGTCRQLIVRLSDGSIHRAVFKFT